jgi:hypothetical protein
MRNYRFTITFSSGWAAYDDDTQRWKVKNPESGRYIIVPYDNVDVLDNGSTRVWFTDENEGVYIFHEGKPVYKANAYTVGIYMAFKEEKPFELIFPEAWAELEWDSRKYRITHPKTGINFHVDHMSVNYILDQIYVAFASPEDEVIIYKHHEIATKIKAKDLMEYFMAEQSFLESVDDVLKQRLEEYGEDDIPERIAKRWSQLLGSEISPRTVCIMMMDLKMARLTANPNHADSVKDLVGYATLAHKYSEDK